MLTIFLQKKFCIRELQVSRFLQWKIDEVQILVSKIDQVKAFIWKNDQLLFLYIAVDRFFET